MAWEIVKAFFIIIGIFIATGLVIQIIWALFTGTKGIIKAIIEIPRFVFIKLPSMIKKFTIKKFFIFMFKDRVNFIMCTLFLIYLFTIPYCVVFGGCVIDPNNLQTLKLSP